VSIENTTTAVSATGEGAASAGASAEVSSTSSTPSTESKGAVGATESTLPGDTAATPAAPAYTPNYKYKAALQEKELDEFWRPLVKDSDSEKKVKDLFSRVDAFDFVKTKRDEIEKQLESVSNDYGQVTQTVQRFNQSVKGGDLSSAFRLAGISRDQIFKWTQQQLALMEMPPEQRQQFEQYENAQSQKTELEQQVSQLQQQYEHQAVQSRTMQLDQALMKPEVSSFAQVWDTNSGQPGAFRAFVVEEAKKVYYESQQDLSPDQAIASVMQRFGKFLNVGDSTAPASQAPSIQAAQAAKPVIPHIGGKAASPIKKVPRSLDDLKKLAKSL
jgi:hypothetical protein